LADLATYREALAATLRAAGRVVYAYPNENITPPAIVLVPGSDQASTVTLEMENNQQVLEVLAGRAYKTVDKTATLNVELFLDDTSSAGIISALWDAALAAPDTALTFSFDVNGDTFAGKVFPVFPTVGGAATDVLTTSLSFVVEDGAVTRT
jgi:hypothetical protein